MKGQLFAASLALALVLAFVVSLGEGFEVKLTHLSTLYLPTFDANGSASFPLPSVSVEQVTFQPQGNLLYAVGE